MSMQLEIPPSASNTTATLVGAEPSRARRVPLHEILDEVAARIAPLWPLADYVAVNPFWGWANLPFLQARQQLVAVRDCDVLPSREYFRQQLAGEALTPGDLARALAEARQEYPEWFDGFDLAAVIQQVTAERAETAPRERRYFTVAELVDQRTGSNWTHQIVNDITRCCAAQADEGQAWWPSPWKGESLYRAWREIARHSHRMDWLGLPEFRDFSAQLPGDEIAAIAYGLRELRIPDAHQAPYLLCLLYSVSGWGAYLKYQSAWREDRRGQAKEPLGDLPGLLAVRLAYEVALSSRMRTQFPQLARECVPADRVRGGFSLQWDEPSRDVLARYVCQLAAEKVYLDRLVGKLSGGPQRAKQEESSGKAAGAGVGSRRSAQVVFCIDVRSEIMRRHLEGVAPSLETWGFAGFFGLPLRQVDCGEEQGRAQCPVLLRPGLAVREKPKLRDSRASERAEQRLRARHRRAEIWKSFQSSASSCFSFVESWGLPYLVKLWARCGLSGLGSGLASWARKLGGASGVNESRRIRPDGPGTDLEMQDMCGGEAAGPLGISRKLDLAEGLLRNLGLLQGFARLVVFCGHTAEVQNNPYQAALDCGACGGHSGEMNARVAARLLNDREVRSGLAARGIVIPEDTWFVAAVHNTTTDEICCSDREYIPATHQADLHWFEARVVEAGDRCRGERSQRWDNTGPADIWRRRRDWSEVRPEWGLAGNASFIAAPRTSTTGLDLGGRSFLHSYDASRDPEGSVLELIMTAPLIVANWINLQYFASTVDNRAFGSGTKTLHNLVGRFGVLSGNGGDLTTGLPWQSVHDGRRSQHEPLRLVAVLAASRSAVERVVERHPRLQELLLGGWLSVVAWEAGQFFQWSSRGWRHVSTGAVILLEEIGR